MVNDEGVRRLRPGHLDGPSSSMAPWKRSRGATIGFAASYEYNMSQREFSVSFDVSFGWSF